MTTISFFRQQRQDGGVRAGIGVDGEIVLQSYEPGGDPPDPSLIWYVDLSFQGKTLPRSIDDAKAWLIEQTPAIRDALLDSAKRLQLGLDVDATWPLRCSIARLPRGVQGELRVSSIPGLREGEIAKALRSTAKDFENMLSAMRPLAAA